VLDDTARAAIQTLFDTLRYHFEQGFFPAAPDTDECRWCDYRPVCGPYEEARQDKKKKDKARLDKLVQLRRRM
jgi:hypothetical protein